LRTGLFVSVFRGIGHRQRSWRDAFRIARAGLGQRPGPAWPAEPAPLAKRNPWLRPGPAKLAKRNPWLRPPPAGDS
jgi:hypothetical protein